MKYLVLLIVLSVTGCSAQPTVTQPTVNSWLDPVTMATITAQAEPLGLARPETRGTVNGRDYVRLSAVEVNRMGTRRLYLVAALWSNANLSDEQWQDFENFFERIEVRAADRSVTLTRLPNDISALGIGQSLPIPGSRHVYFPIERAELRAMAESNGMQLNALGRSDAPLRYQARKDGRQSLSDFLNQLPGEAANLQGSGMASKTPTATTNAGGS